MSTQKTEGPAPGDPPGNGAGTTAEDREQRSRNKRTADKPTETEAEALRVLHARGVSMHELNGTGPDGTCHCRDGANCTSPGKDPQRTGWTTADGLGLPMIEAIAARALAAHREGKGSGAGVLARTGDLPDRTVLFVVDIDGPDARQRWDALVAEHGDPGDTFTVDTLRPGGRHLYFLAPAGTKIKTGTDVLGKGIDVRGHGGYVVAPGTVIRNYKGTGQDGVYRVVSGAPFAQASEWLIERVRKTERPTTSPDRLAPQPEDISPEELDRRRRYLAPALDEIRDRCRAMREAAVDEWERHKEAYKGEDWDDTCWKLIQKAVEVDNSLGGTEAVDLFRAEAPRDAGFGDAEVERMIRRAYDHVGDRGRDVPPALDAAAKQLDRGTATPAATEASPDDAADLLGARAMTDVNLTDVFAAMYADTACYVPETRTWLRWTGTHWKPTDEADIIGLSSLFALDLVRAVAKQGDPERTKQAAGRQSRARVEAIVALSKGNGLIRVNRDQLDRHPHLLNAPNGVVDLRTGELLPHDPDLLITKVTSARYVPGATHPDWDKVLADLDPEVVDFLQINMGQATTGEPPNDDKATVLYGLGSNAKSTLMVACMKALGDGDDGYARLVSERVLVVDGKGNQHPTELTELLGVRLAVLEELPNRGELSMERLKKVTGETIEARKIRADTIRWRASHTLFLTTNFHPRVRETDVGSWRRVRLVDFPIRYVRTQEEVTGPNVRLGDIHLRPRIQKARAQQETVLAWLVAGAQRYYEMGQQLPAEPALVQQATQAWRDSSDPLGRFLSEHCEPAIGWCIPGDDLYKHFRAALLEHGHVPWTDQTFTERMKGQPLLTSGRVTKGRPRVSEAPHESRPQVSHHPDEQLVTVTYKDGQKVHAYVGLRWREGGQR